MPIRKPDWLGEAQTPPARVPGSATRPAPLLFDAEHRAIRTADAWARRREELRRAWRRFLGTVPGPRPDNSLEVLETDRPEGVVRRLVRYRAEAGLPVEGYWLVPEAFQQGKHRRWPAVVVLHSTTDDNIRQPAGLAGPPDKHIGLHLARRGFVAFCPRCYLWQYRRGKNWRAAVDWFKARHPGVTGMAKMLHDATRAVDLLAAMPEIDPARIGAIGHSLGGKETLYLSAFDPRIRAAVSSEGGIGLSYSNWHDPWYLGPEIQRPGFPLDHGQVLALCAPRAFLLVGGNSADGDQSWPYIAEALPLWKLLGAPEAVGLFNHRAGHAFPPVAQSRSYEWLEWSLNGPNGPRKG